MVEVINKRIKDFSKTIDIIQTILFFLIALLVPTFLGNLIKIVFGAGSVVTRKFTINSRLSCKYSFNFNSNKY